MKRILLALLAVALCGMMAFAAGCGNTPDDSGNPSNPSNPSNPTEPEKPDDSGATKPLYTDSDFVESERTDGLKLAVDSLSGAKYHVRMTGDDKNIVPNTQVNHAVAIQAALDELYNKYKGGILFLKKGTYIIASQIKLPRNTGIVGEWCAPEGENASKITSGTVFDIRVKAADSSARADATIRLEGNNLLSGITIGYSDQSFSSPKKYPYTISNGHSVGFEIHNLTLLNSYRGIIIDDQNVYALKNVYITALETGFYANYNYDVPTWYNVNLSYKYWTQAPQDSPFYKPGLTESVVREITRTATALRFGRVDWQYLDTALVEGYEKALVFEKGTNKDMVGSIRETNGQFMYLTVKDCKYGLYIDTASEVGSIFTACDIEAAGDGSAAIHVTSGVNNDYLGNPDYNTAYQFNACTFKSDKGYGSYSVGNALLSFNNCTFADWAQNAVYAERGNYIIDTCTFANKANDINFASNNVQTAKVINCTFEGGKQIQNSIGTDNAERYIEKTENYTVAPKFAHERYAPSPIPRAGTENVYYASDYGAVADGVLSAVGNTDNTKALQHAMNAAAKNGGGYVILDAGYYWVKDYLVVPEKVVLKGNAVTNKHFVGGRMQTTLITEQGKEDANGHAFITLDADAGLENICVYYPTQKAAAPIAYAPTVHVKGKNAHVYMTSFIGTYRSFLITGENALVASTRTFGLKTSYEVEKANGARIEYGFSSVNDWMRIPHWGNDMPNCPPDGYHNNYPCNEGDVITVNNSDNVKLYQIFSYGVAVGVRLTGNVNNLYGVSVGVDLARTGYLMDNSGTGNVFVNGQITVKEAEVRAAANYTGETAIYNTNSWYSQTQGKQALFEGGGVVYMQQFKMKFGGVKAVKGMVWLQNLIFDSSKIFHVELGDNAKGGIINSIGGIDETQGFLTDGSGEDFLAENNTSRLFVQ